MIQSAARNGRALLFFPAGNSMNFADIATRYANAGLHVLPLIPKGKNPIIKSIKNGGTGKGVYDATTDEATIKAWGKKYPSSNIGVHPGPSGMIGLDFDTKDDNGVRGARPNGLDTLEELREAIPEIDDAWIVATPTGGFHYYFATPEGFEFSNPVRVMRGLDIRHKGTLLVLPPSEHPEGGKYHWQKREGDEPPEMPRALQTRLREALASRRGGAASKAFEDDDSPITERHSVLISIGAVLRNRGLDGSAIKAALMDINERRCSPEPLAESEIDRIVEGNLKLTPAHNLADYAKSKFAPELSKSNAAKGKKRLRVTKYSDIKKEKLDWIWFGRIAVGKITLAVGMPGKGKSYGTCAIAAAVTRGQYICGDHRYIERMNTSTKPASVLMLTYEDGQGDTIKPRLELCDADMERVYTIPHTEEQFTVNDIALLEDILTEHKDIRLVIIDPFQSIMVGIDGNNDETLRQKLSPLVAVAQRNKVAILAVKHLNKNEKATIENRIGGSVGYAGIARTILMFGHDNRKEYEKGHTYGGVCVIKGNLEEAGDPVAYEITSNGFKWLGTDQEITPDTLLPVPRDSKNAKR